MQECLDSWLKVSGRCPLCQKPAIVTKKTREGKKASVSITRSTSSATAATPMTPEAASTASRAQPASAIPTVIDTADRLNSPASEGGNLGDRVGVLGNPPDGENASRCL